eukprot:scaffold3499_cov247-Pinguiococcus_pyrenoidosus.AAC.12
MRLRSVTSQIRWENKERENLPGRLKSWARPPGEGWKTAHAEPCSRAPIGPAAPGQSGFAELQHDDRATGRVPSAC